MIISLDIVEIKYIKCYNIPRKLGVNIKLKRVSCSIISAGILFSTSAATNWGLWYENGVNQPPNGQDTVNTLYQYSAYFMADTSKNTIYLFDNLNIDSESKLLSVYNISNNNYISLKELWDMLGIDIIYDAQTNSVNMKVK